MVDAIVSVAIQKLDDFVTQQVHIRTGVTNGVEWLRAELTFLLASARCAEARQEEELIRLWINSINDAANEAVLILDRFDSQQKENAGSHQGFLDRMRSCVCICKKEANLYDIGKDLESLKERVVLIKNRRDEYGIGNILAIPNVQRRKRSLLRATSFENYVEVVGFKDDVQTLMAQLRKKGTLGMISIHGMGGLGKSTLASKLYHSRELRNFTRRAWVCVSEDYSIENVLRKIIKCFNEHEKDSLHNMEEEDLLRHLREVLQASGCYLVVIDDIWDLKVWEKIKNAFPHNEGCRVIITTRDKKVAEGVDDQCFVHKLRFLSEDESWQLFCKRAKPTQNLEEIGKDMVGKCRGLPLAIVVLSGLLLHQKSYTDWSRVKDHIWRRLKDDSLEIQEILSLSYEDLPFKMRQCFLYLARFPEDHIFEVDRLMQLWIAEDFISEADEGDGVFMEDVAEYYLSELINRNMIETARFRFDGVVFSCRIHDLVRDLAMQKAREQGLLDIFDTSKQLLNPSSLREKRRHVVYNGIGEYLLLEPSSDDSKLRSVALINKIDSYVKIEVIKLTYVRFKYLKVLDLTHVESDQMPEEVGDLVLLKFLGLMASPDYREPLVIPPSIGKLTKLQTLRGSDGSSYEAPREICELKELRHLSSLRCMPEPEGGGLNIGSNQTKLQTLDIWWHVNWIHIETTKLTNLQALSIQDESPDEHPLDSISDLTGLQTFYINFACANVVPTIKPLSSCKRLNSVFLRCTINDPSELKFLPDSVTILSLTHSEFREDPMPVLGSLPNLATLFLVEAHKEKEMVCSPNSFPNLQFLVLSYLSVLEKWRVEEGALTSLQGLDVHRCKNLTMIPPQVERIPRVPATFNYME
ncbi:hypothetical protein DCAR_0521538 [Daucus carota subsp. sativus]|uniref:AAA+ ATPase domain-containing protein n=2 Tax=Daucus carota subsp. sativus TaxID=79200 RepID=A0AAF1B140_DAUCS|nr:PREDICTED: disease resistance protein RPP13-like [Daucus carota subsp. sativus]WOH02150.1 hypothetical protein DCAR_0521538 [Daucus carota subsp. sativus]